MMIIPDPLVEAQARDGLLLVFCCFIGFVFLFYAFIAVFFAPDIELEEKDNQ